MLEYFPNDHSGGSGRLEGRSHGASTPDLDQNVLTLHMTAPEYSRLSHSILLARCIFPLLPTGQRIDQYHARLDLPSPVLGGPVWRVYHHVMRMHQRLAGYRVPPERWDTSTVYTLLPDRTLRPSISITSHQLTLRHHPRTPPRIPKQLLHLAHILQTHPAPRPCPSFTP